MLGLHRRLITEVLNIHMDQEDENYVIFFGISAVKLFESENIERRDTHI